jgi:hypothetical protein
MQAADDWQPVNPSTGNRVTAVSDCGTRYCTVGFSTDDRSHLLAILQERDEDAAERFLRFIEHQVMMVVDEPLIPVVMIPNGKQRQQLRGLGDELQHIVTKIAALDPRVEKMIKDAADDDGRPGVLTKAVDALADLKAVTAAAIRVIPLPRLREEDVKARFLVRAAVSWYEEIFGRMPPTSQNGRFCAFVDQVGVLAGLKCGARVVRDVIKTYHVPDPADEDAPAF